MDALALLCNLYGDGPQTLRRLRESGQRECADVARLAIEDLAHLLGTSTDAALRFQREARELSARVTGHELLASAGAPRNPRLEAVLSEWRERDERDARAGEPPAALPVAAQPEPGVAATPLRPALLDGLDLEICVKLREVGVDNVEELASSEALDVARSMDLGVTRMIRLKYLAQRYVGATRAAPAEPASTLKPEAAVPAAAPSDGPFGGPRRGSDEARSVHLPPRFSPAEPTDPARPAPHDSALERELADYARREVERDASEPAGSAGPFA